jgi:hypothetical protein
MRERWSMRSPRQRLYRRVCRWARAFGPTDGNSCSAAGAARCEKLPGVPRLSIQTRCLVRSKSASTCRVSSLVWRGGAIGPPTAEPMAPRANGSASGGPMAPRANGTASGGPMASRANGSASGGPMAPRANGSASGAPMAPAPRGPVAPQTLPGQANGLPLFGANRSAQVRPMAPALWGNSSARVGQRLPLHGAIAPPGSGPTLSRQGQ